MATSSWNVNFLYDLGLFNIKLGLVTIKQLLAKLGNPQHLPNIVHVAGTNGKGSTIVTLESLLIASGYQVATTVSPHLTDFKERFRYQGEFIKDDELESVFKQVMAACNIGEHNLDDPSSWFIRPTFFEAQIAMFFLWARQKNPDYVLVETGLGGRLDATNVVRPKAVAITAISYDHQSYLGASLAKITAEKLGILKQSVPCFVAKQSNSVLKAIRAANYQNDFYFYGTDFGYKYHKTGKIFFTKLKNSSHRYSSCRQKNYRCLIEQPGLIGKHQWHNTATALALYYYLTAAKKTLPPLKINQQLAEVSWSGRLQYLACRPPILLDVAHNAAGMKSLFYYLKYHHQNSNILFAVCWLKEKKLGQIIAKLKTSDAAFRNMVFQPLSLLDNKRATAGHEIMKILQDKNFDSNHPLLVKEFIAKLRQGKYAEFDLILVAGSVFLVAEFLHNWRKQKT